MEHHFFFGSFLSYSLTSQGEVFPVGGSALSLTPSDTLGQCPWGETDGPQLKPELTYSIFCSKTVLEG